MSIFSARTKQLIEAMRRLAVSSYSETRYFEIELDETGSPWSRRIDVLDSKRRRLGSINDVVDLHTSIGDDFITGFLNEDGEDTLDWGSISNQYDYVAEACTSFTIFFDLEDKTYTICGEVEVEYTSGGSTEEYSGISGDDDYAEWVEEALKELEDNRIKYVKYVTYAGGDSGYIEDHPHEQEPMGDEEMDLSNFNADVEGNLYKLLNANGGWEINEGSNSHFEFDVEKSTLTFEFAWNNREMERIEGETHSIL